MSKPKSKLHKHWVCCSCAKPCLMSRGMFGNPISDCCGAPAKDPAEAKFSGK